MAAPRRTRRVQTGSGAVDELKALVDSLIKENQRLKRQVARLETQTVGRVAITATRGLTTMARRLERALGSTATGRRGRATSSRAPGRTRRLSTSAAKPRKPASPETQAKRLAALARARAVRAAKRAESS
jgi:hypothetical protein